MNAVILVDLGKGCGGGGGGVNREKRDQWHKTKLREPIRVLIFGSEIQQKFITKKKRLGR